MAEAERAVRHSLNGWVQRADPSSEVTSLRVWNGFGAMVPPRHRPGGTPGLAKCSTDRDAASGWDGRW
jgi:hypothetical protein